MRRTVVVVGLVLASGVAAAEDLQPPGLAPRAPLAPLAPLRAHARPVQDRVALAVNLPFGWRSAQSGSLYIGLTDHQALRLNVAHYDYRDNPAVVGLALALGGGYEDESYNGGDFFDVGAGWMFFPRRLWSGPTLEVGLNRRAAHTDLVDDNMDPREITRDSTTYAGRAMAGWSWDFGDRWFISMALGASYGYAHGSGYTKRDPLYTSYPPMPPMPEPYSIHRWEAAFECYTRVGVAL